MNILLIIALLLFACAVIWIYFLFMASSVNESSENIKKEEEKEEEFEEQTVVEKCEKLFEQGLHAELQRYAQRELSKNYGDVELRRILAKSLMASGNEQMAIAHYEAILSITPYDTPVQEFLADYYYNNGQRVRAIDLYEQIIMYEPGNVNAVETLSKLYYEVQDYAKCATMNEMLLEAEVDEAKKVEFEYILAELYTRTNDINRAYEIYKKILKTDPDNVEILSLLADLSYKNSAWEECLFFYQKIISITGDDFEILEKVAQLLTTLENWEEAILVYKKIIALESSDNINYLYHQNELCNAMLKNGQYKEAIDLLKDLLTQNPKETSFAFTLAQAYTLMGEFEVGVKLYNKLLDALPSEQSEIIVKYISNLICSWAQDLFKKGDYNQAFDKFFEALKYDENNDDVYFQLGKCNYYIKSFQDAIAHFKRAIALKPSESRYYFGLGCAYDEMGSYKNAEIAFFDAININPQDVQARIAYAISLTKELEYAKSIQQFSEVLKYIPDDPDTLYNLALAYELVGDIERAIKFYRRTLEIDKNHKEAKHNIELLLDEPYEAEDEVSYIDDIEETPKENDMFAGVKKIAKDILKQPTELLEQEVEIAAASENRELEEIDIEQE